MTRYTALLGVSARRDLTDSQALLGEQLFGTAGCASCHVPQMQTGNEHPYGELRGQTIRAFTDLLLHDMGPGLAANMNDGDASPAEWRTPPLWNIGLTSDVSGGEAYLHDGRARTLEEAILWHDGEGAAAKESFRTMSASDRAALVAFRLGNTVPDRGSVSRGVCAVDDGRLVSIEEHRTIERDDSGVLRSEFGPLGEATPVSMNLWCFDHSMLGLLQERFDAFLEMNAAEPKAECLLPMEVGAVMSDGLAVEVLDSPERWIGVTNPEDLERARALLSGRTA